MSIFYECFYKLYKEVLNKKKTRGRIRAKNRIAALLLLALDFFVEFEALANLSCFLIELVKKLL